MINLEKRKGIPSCKGYYTTKSERATYHYDSMSELAMMILLDDSGKYWIKNTKLKIPYLFEGKQRNYIPDFIIEETVHELKTILEIKGSNDKPELPFKCEAAEKYCKENNIKFYLMPYEEIKKLVDWAKVKEYHYKNKK